MGTCPLLIECRHSSVAVITAIIAEIFKSVDNSVPELFSTFIAKEKGFLFLNCVQILSLLNSQRNFLIPP